MRDLNALLETVRAEAQVPALAAALIEKNRLVALGAAGRRRADKDDQVQRDDRFHIGSCTKSMTATLVARLVEMGKLDWSSTVAEVLSDIRKSIRREYWKVTVEQLLTHRSGMPQNLSAHRQLFSRLWNRSATQRLQAVRIILQEKPVASPGEKTIYSNGGYVVAGAMVEAVMDKTELMQEHLFRPLGIKSAGFGAPTAGAWGHRSVAGRYSPVPPSPLADNPPFLGPAGTVHLSLPDWARFAILHLKGASEENPPLLRKATFVKLHTPPAGSTYAMGWGVSQPSWAQQTALQHAGSNTMWLAQILLLPRSRRSFLVATNAGDERASGAVRRVMEVLRQ